MLWSRLLFWKTTKRCNLSFSRRTGQWHHDTFTYCSWNEKCHSDSDQ